MRWTAKATGDMTLSIMDDTEFQILKVDMLGAGTLKAGTDGDLLIKALNDLHIIANFAADDYDMSDDNLEFPGGGFSPLPWEVLYDSQKRKLVVKSGKKKIADRIFPANTPDNKVLEVVECISYGISLINAADSQIKTSN